MSGQSRLDETSLATPARGGQRGSERARALARGMRAADRPRTRALRAAIAAASGLLLYLTFAPFGFWWLAPIGLALLYSVLRDTGPRAGFVLGGVAGLAMSLPLLWWAGEYVGPIGSVPLALLQGVLVALSTAAIAVVTRLPAAPVWAALLWVAGEALRSVFPFGGFPWARLAFGQVEGVLLPLAAVAGAPMVSFAVALSGFFLADFARALRPGRRGPGLMVAICAALAPVLAGAWAAVLVDTSPEQGELTVAVVQGNVPQPGLDFNAERRAVLDNHVEETRRLARAVQAGEVTAPELVVWPENSSDIDPYTNPDAYRRITQAAESVGVPILVGAVVGGGGPAPRNTVLLWDPAQGPVAEYAKRRLQPFGETMPMRGFFRLFSEKVDRAGRFVPGEDATVLTVGAANVAIAMCYEVIFDDEVRDSVRNGANLLAVPSNNATFGYSNMTYQQLAIDRFRAVEHGRSVVVPTTSGVSAIIWPDGRVVARTGMFQPATLVSSVPLRSSLTIADRLGAAPEWLMSGVGTIALAVSLLRRHRSRTSSGSRAAVAKCTATLTTGLLLSMGILPAPPTASAAAATTPSPGASPTTPFAQTSPTPLPSPGAGEVRADRGERIFSFVVMGLALGSLTVMVAVLAAGRRRDVPRR